MELRVLGPLEVIVDEIAVKLRPKEAELLCALAVDPGHSLKEHELIDALWGEPPPPSASKSLQAHIARLRVAIGVQRIERTRDGYRLAIGDIELDVASFVRISAEEADLDQMRAAVAMLRGTPYDELPAWGPAVEARSRLMEVHTALEERVGALLLSRVGARRAIPELDRLVHAQPLRERRWALLAVALAADGRSVEALRTIQQAREQFREVSGLDIGADLAQVERDILDGRSTSHGSLVDLPVVATHTPRLTPAKADTAVVGGRTPRLSWLLVPLLLLSSGIGGWLAIAGTGDPRPPDAAAASPTIPSAPQSTITAVPVLIVPPTQTAPAATSASPASPTHQPRLKDVPCTSLSELAAAPTDRQGPLREDTVCFKLIVPQRRDSPTSPEVQLDVALQPGESALPVITAGDFRSLATPTPGPHIVVAIRGGMGSEPSIECHELVEPLEVALGPGGPLPDALVDPGAACARRLADDGIDVSAFGATDAADDLADLADLLEYEQIQLQVADGVGTWIAQRLIERHEGLVASLVLQDPIAVGQVVPDRIPTTLASGWRRYVALCAAAPDCASAYPDLDGDWSTWVADGEQSPLTVVVNTAESPTGVNVVVDELVLQLALMSALDIPATVPLLAGVVHAQDSDVAGRFVGSIVLPRASTLASAAGFWCSEEWPHHNPAVAASQLRLSPRFGHIQRWSQMERGLCAVWPHAAPSAAPTALDVPTLVIRGRLSPYLDPDWDGELLRVFPDQRTLELATVTFGTDANTPPCLAEVLSTWWSKGSLEASTLEKCSLSSPPLTFAVG